MAKEITIYSTRTCVYCNMLKDYLKSKNVKFEEILLDEQPEEIQSSLDACGSMGVPCTHIKLEDGREENILGFDRARFDRILGL
ncbi:MAG TPA: glutaredoxin domain-containing protein [Candidatus Saccharimonadales bacterium]|nr:glutaredoxin domain-containing protein [Candidatus Saccharimonadales bacterium]